MATLAAQTILRTGLAATYASAGGSGDEYVNTGYEFLHVKNGSGGSINVTVASQVGAAAPPGTAATNAVVAVGAGADKFIGPFPISGYSDANSKVQVTYSATTTITVAVLKFAA